MNKILLFGFLGVAVLGLGGCQSPRAHEDDFAAKTHRTYNPQTGTFEQSPPWGKQGNKDDTGQ